jgi:Bacterial RNA polymerase, alpha chain C terminal domain
MKVTVSFANPFLVMLYSASMLAIGWAVGSNWGGTVTAAWMLFVATVFFSLHDACLVILLTVAVSRIKSSGTNKELDSAHARTAPTEHERNALLARVAAAENPNRRRSRHAMNLDIEELEFSVRTQNKLKHAEVHTLNALLRRSEEDLLNAGFTAENVSEIKTTLEELGLRLDKRGG